MRIVRFLASVLVASLVVWLASLLPTRNAQASAECPDSRVYAEAQSWWRKAPGAPPSATDFGHLHVGACIPERDTVRSDTTVPITVTMHHTPGRLLDISVVYKGRDSEETVAKVKPSRRTCPVTTTCTIMTQAPIWTDKFEASGLQEVRFRAFVDEPDGKQMHASLNWQVNVQNGEEPEPVIRYPYLRGKGWYTDFGYCEPDILTTPLPDRPVRGILRLRVSQVDHGPDDVDPTHHLVALDSNAHTGLAGTVLRQGEGSLPPTTIAINTKRLKNGSHRLVQRVDCQEDGQINSGILVLRFQVAN